MILTHVTLVRIQVGPHPFCFIRKGCVLWLQGATQQACDESRTCVLWLWRAIQQVCSIEIPGNLIYSVEMSCASCARKRAGAPGAFFAAALAASGDPAHWGPVLWNILHILANRCGRSGNALTDLEESRLFDFLITNLPLVLPCEECAGHARIYIATNPLRCVGLKGSALTDHLQTWLMNFHNAVRLRKHQAIEITTIDALRTHYADHRIDEDDVKLFMANIIFGVRMMLVKSDNWKRWVTQFQKLRLIVGA